MNNNALEVAAQRQAALSPLGSTPFPEAQELVAFQNAAAWIARSRMFPQFTNAEQAFVGMLLVRDLGLSMVQGLPLVYPVEGKLFVEVKGRIASLMAKCPTFEWVALAWTAERIHIKARLRAFDEWKEMEFTLEDAKRAGRVKAGSAWEKYPKDMLMWRCLSRWINSYAPHLLYAMPTRVLEMDEESEEQPGGGAAAPATAGPGATGTPGATDGPAQGVVEPAVSPPAEDVDYRKEFAARARKMGKKSNSDFLSLLRIVFKELGLTPPTTYGEVTTDEWEKGYRFLDSRYDENGKPRPREVENEVEDEAPPPAEVQTPVPAKPTDNGGVAHPEVEIPTLDDEPEPLPPEKGPDFGWMLSGKVDGLIELCNLSQRKFKERGQTAVRFLAETSGSGIWFVEPDTLTRCGSEKGGKPVPVLLQMEDGADPRYERHLATDGLRVMLARGVKEMLDTLEVGR